MKKYDDLIDTPFNMDTRYLHGINVRLEVLIEQVSSLVDYLANKDKVAVTDNTVIPDFLNNAVIPVALRKKK